MVSGCGDNPAATDIAGKRGSDPSKPQIGPVLASSALGILGELQLTKSGKYPARVTRFVCITSPCGLGIGMQCQEDVTYYMPLQQDLGVLLDHSGIITTRYVYFAHRLPPSPQTSVSMVQSYLVCSRLIHTIGKNMQVLPSTHMPSQPHKGPCLDAPGPQTV